MDADSDDADSDDGAPEDASPYSGPLAMLVDRATMVADPVCNVDGVGGLDNVLAQLDPTELDQALGVLNGVLEYGVLNDVRLLAYAPDFPSCDGTDTEHVEIVLFAANGIEDVERPYTSGCDDKFLARADYLGPCGEPLYVARGDIQAGHLLIAADRAPLPPSPEPIIIENALLDGTIVPDGSEMQVTVCGYVTAASLGESPILGRPGVDWVASMVQPDIDLDGDGLERFEVEGGRIVRCVDGRGGTPIEGPDCWKDPRIADAFSMTMDVHLCKARVVGCQGRHLYPPSCNRVLGGLSPCSARQ